MKEGLYELDMDSWATAFSETKAQEITRALEGGKVIFLPKLNFSLDPAQQSLLNNININLKGAKNISYDPKSQRLGGIKRDTMLASLLTTMMQRYYQQTAQLLQSLCPNYQAEKYCGRTSFRPIEIKGRKAESYRKDDTRLHVDAFPSTPVNEYRILRVFTNINPYGESRYWNLGEPFSEVIRKFFPKVRPRFPFESVILHALKATRKKRSYYDHCMLQIHNKMKADMNYQQQCRAIPVNFPPGSTWIVYTDLVSHAALAGRFVLEQTYYLPVDKMLNPALAPQAIIQQQRIQRAVNALGQKI